MGGRCWRAWGGREAGICPSHHLNRAVAAGVPKLRRGFGGAASPPQPYFFYVRHGKAAQGANPLGRSGLPEISGGLWKLEPGFFYGRVWRDERFFLFFRRSYCVYARAGGAVADRVVVRGHTLGTPFLMTLNYGRAIPQQLYLPPARWVTSPPDRLFTRAVAIGPRPGPLA